MFKHSRENIQRWVWHVKPENYGLMKKSFEDTAKLDRKPFFVSLICLTASVGVMNLLTPTDPTSNPPTFVMIAILMNLLIAIMSLMSISVILHFYFKGRKELLIFREEYARRLEEFIDKKEVS
jgi:hypothetical protein